MGLGLSRPNTLTSPPPSAHARGDGCATISDLWNPPWRIARQPPCQHWAFAEWGAPAKGGVRASCQQSWAKRQCARTCCLLAGSQAGTSTLVLQAATMRRLVPPSTRPLTTRVNASPPTWYEKEIDAFFQEFPTCKHAYIDVGTNVGVQIRKLFEPHLYPGSGMTSIFRDVFPGSANCRAVCAIGIEPNPTHRGRLRALQERLRGAGAGVLILFAAAGTKDGHARIYSGKANNASGDQEWGATVANVAWNPCSVHPGRCVFTRTLDLARVVHRTRTALERANAGHQAQIVMKLDVEGAEFDVLEALQGASGWMLCEMARVLVEFHAWAMGTRAAAMHAVARWHLETFSGRMDSRSFCHTRVEEMDDESFAQDGMRFPAPGELECNRGRVVG